MCRPELCSLTNRHRSVALVHTHAAQNHASVSEKDERWTLRKVGVLHGLALSLARVGEHAAAEDKLLEAIRELRELDGVDADDTGRCAHRVRSWVPLYRFAHRLPTKFTFRRSCCRCRRRAVSWAGGPRVFCPTPPRAV